MTLLYILAAICILAAALLLMPVGFRLLYEDHAVLWVRIGFLSFRVLPQKEKIRKLSRKAKKPGDKVKPPADTRTIIETVRTAVHEAGRLFRKLTVRRLDFQMLCAGPDAAAAAIQYGQVCAAAGTILPVLKRYFALRRPDIRLDVDYIKTTPEIHADVIVAVSTVYVLRAAWIMAVSYVRALFDNKSKKTAKKPLQKQEAET